MLLRRLLRDRPRRDLGQAIGPRLHALADAVASSGETGEFGGKSSCFRIWARSLMSATDVLHAVIVDVPCTFAVKAHALGRQAA